MLGVVLLAGGLPDVEGRGEHEGNHVGVHELPGKAGEHPVQGYPGW